MFPDPRTRGERCRQTWNHKEQSDISGQPDGHWHQHSKLFCRHHHKGEFYGANLKACNQAPGGMITRSSSQACEATQNTRVVVWKKSKEWYRLAITGWSKMGINLSTLNERVKTDYTEFWKWRQGIYVWSNWEEGASEGRQER